VSRYLLDASAVLAVLNAETGADIILAALTAGGSISAVNFSEVVSKLADQHLTEVETNTVLESLELEVLDFTTAHAYQSGRLRSQTRTAGLSIADRACLAVAKSLNLPVLTADHNWSRVDVGVKVEIFR
jgi:ribonuclease VapC